MRSWSISIACWTIRGSLAISTSWRRSCTVPWAPTSPPRSSAARAFLTVDVPALYQEIRTAAKVIGGEQRRRAEMLQRLKPYYQRWYQDWLGDETQPFYVLNSRV